MGERGSNSAIRPGIAIAFGDENKYQPPQTQQETLALEHPGIPDRFAILLADEHARIKTTPILGVPIGPLMGGLDRRISPAPLRAQCRTGA